MSARLHWAKSRQPLSEPTGTTGRADVGSFGLDRPGAGRAIDLGLPPLAALLKIPSPGRPELRCNPSPCDKGWTRGSSPIKPAGDEVRASSNRSKSALVPRLRGQRPVVAVAIEV